MPVTDRSFREYRHVIIIGMIIPKAVKNNRESTVTQQALPERQYMHYQYKV